MRQADFLREVLSGQPSPESLAWLAAGARRWLEQEVDRPLPLERMLGIGRPRSVRAEMRRHHLRAAAALLDAPTRWKRCVELAEACRAFEARRWPVWRRLDAPPAHASPVDVELWRARQFGALAQEANSFLDVLDE